MFDGVARRVVRVDVGTRPDGRGESDVARRFGIREYYEMQVFTDDSQNYPLVFCVRELPAGFPIGGDVRVSVRVAGFFFKDWLYTTRGTRSDDAGEGDAAGPAAQFAPLLVGRAPLVLQMDSAQNSMVQWILAGVFVLTLAGVWALAWWFACDNRRFHQRLRAASSSPEVGQSLKELLVPPHSGSSNFPSGPDFSASRNP
jgi:hypothetical protein